MRKNHEKQANPYQLATVSAGEASAGGIKIADTNLPDGNAVAVKINGQIVILPNAGG